LPKNAASITSPIGTEEIWIVKAQNPLVTAKSHL
jgi:hypothetical protein